MVQFVGTGPVDLVRARKACIAAMGAAFPGPVDRLKHRELVLCFLTGFQNCLYLESVKRGEEFRIQVGPLYRDRQWDPGPAWQWW